MSSSGTPNNYVYPAHPVNDNDLTGDFDWKSIANLTSFVSMETMLVQSRSFGLAMVLTHQHLDQLAGPIRSAVQSSFPGRSR